MVSRSIDSHQESAAAVEAGSTEREFGSDPRPHETGDLSLGGVPADGRF
jgi:hypothetical protein